MQHRTQSGGRDVEGNSQLNTRGWNCSTLGISRSEASSHAWNRSSALQLAQQQLRGFMTKRSDAPSVPNPVLFDQTSDPFFQREQCHAVWLRLPSLPFNLNYMLYVTATSGRSDCLRSISESWEFEDVIELQDDAYFDMRNIMSVAILCRICKSPRFDLVVISFAIEGAEYGCCNITTCPLPST